MPSQILETHWLTNSLLYILYTHVLTFMHRKWQKYLTRFDSADWLFPPKEDIVLVQLKYWL